MSCIFAEAFLYILFVLVSIEFILDKVFFQVLFYVWLPAKIFNLKLNFQTLIFENILGCIHLV